MARRRPRPRQRQECRYGARAGNRCSIAGEQDAPNRDHPPERGQRERRLRGACAHAPSSCRAVPSCRSSSRRPRRAARNPANSPERPEGRRRPPGADRPLARQLREASARSGRRRLNISNPSEQRADEQGSPHQTPRPTNTATRPAPAPSPTPSRAFSVSTAWSTFPRKERGGERVRARHRQAEADAQAGGGDEKHRVERAHGSLITNRLTRAAPSRPGPPPGPRDKCA